MSPLKIIRSRLHRTPRIRTLYCMIGALISFLTGCSPGYVVRAAYEQSKILLARRPIEYVINDPSTVEEDRKKLRFVLDARSFGAEIGLQPGKSFTAYSDVGKDTLAWVVVASRKDAFVLHAWWFPIVGTVPYKGFFDKDDAESQAKSLEEKGYEASVRGTEAFSTLGWFNDPLLSTTLRNSTPRIVNTVLHESVHSTVWIKNNVAFNETLASFVGSQATIEFFERQKQQCPATSAECSDLNTYLQTAIRDHAFQLELAGRIEELYRNLEALYSDPNRTSAQKIEQRVSIFEETMRPFRARYPHMTSLQRVNNAEIMQFTLYMTDLAAFEKLFTQSNSAWPQFFSQIKAIAQAIEEDSSKDPFKELTKMVYSSSTPSAANP